MSESPTPTDQLSPTLLPSLFDQKIVVCGTIRNCGASLESDFLKIKEALRRFKHVYWFLVESDSDDDSINVLNQFSSKHTNFRFISLGMLANDIPMRTDRIAYCRNRYLEDMSQFPEYADANYLLVADLDGMQGLLTEDAFLSCFEDDNWDVLTSNQIGPYYDIWALRQEYWSPNDCWQHKAYLDQFKVGNGRSFFSAIYSRMINIPPNSPRIAVDSAFGGLAIYKTKVIDANTRYVGNNPSHQFRNGEVSEHVAFHQAIRSKGGKIFINPKLINTGINQHSQKAINSLEVFEQLNQAHSAKK